MIIALTGHRPDRLGGYAAINPVRHRVRDRLVMQLKDLGVDRWQGQVYTGMALGFDQWGAEACWDNGIPFVAAIPFPGHEFKWPASAQQVYRFLLDKAERVQITGPTSSTGAFQARNRWMVDRADAVIACYDGSPGGTRNCVEYAELKGKTVHNIWTPDLLK